MTEDMTVHVKVIWWWNFRATQQMRDVVSCAGFTTIFVIVVQFLTFLVKAGLLGQGRVLRAVRRLVSSAGRRLDDFYERRAPQGPAPT